MEQIFSQVIGWSVHSIQHGIIGPLYVNTSGQLFFLDVNFNMGYKPVKIDEDRVFRDDMNE